MRPVLLLVNGLPGSGKTTAARAVADLRPPALALDLDAVRAMVGGGDLQRAGLLARRLAVAMAAEHLGAGHDVVVGQHLGLPGFVLALERVAEERGAAFVETALAVPVATAAARVRARVPVTRADEQVAASLDSPDLEAELRRMQGWLDALRDGRPATVAVPDGPLDEVAAALARLVARASGDL